MTHAHGADFSSFQDDQHLQAALAQGLTFAMVKTTEGVAYMSPKARMQIARLEANGIFVGAYHFLTSTHDGAAQWDHFEQTATLTRAGLVAVDQETDETGVLVPDSIAKAFIRRGHQRGFKVGRYGDGRVMRRNLGEDWRWVAWWGTVPPPLKWDVWQFAAGVHGTPDWDVFNGDVEHLRAWAKRMGAGARKHPAAVSKRWWLHDDFAKAARGPYRLAQLGPAAVAYLARRPRTSRLRLERK